MKWAIWAVVLLAQNASFTWVSRARNSGSVKYHGMASIFSNGVWFISQFFVIDTIRRAIESHDTRLAVFTGLFYTAITTIGAMSMHHFLMKKVEKGKLKVGS